MAKIDVFKQIPDYRGQRDLKDSADYTSHPIDENDPRFHEELVPISAYGIKGKSYYGQPNRVTGEAVPGVSEDVYVRRSVAEKLAAVNHYLRSDGRIADALAGPVELNVRDGLRSLALQTYLREVAIPGIVRKQHPDWDESKVMEEASRKIAPGNPNAPHPSGGVVDVNLVYLRTGDNVFNAQGKDIADEAVYPEFLEQVLQNLRNGSEVAIPTALEGLSVNEFERALHARRILFNLMQDASVGDGDVSMVVNPVEVWHYGYGDRLSAMVQSFEQGRLVMAHFGPAPDPGLER